MTRQKAKLTYLQELLLEDVLEKRGPKYYHADGGLIRTITSLAKRRMVKKKLTVGDLLKVTITRKGKRAVCTVRPRVKGCPKK